MTDGEKFKGVEKHDFRVRGKRTPRKMSQGAFIAQYDEITAPVAAHHEHIVDQSQAQWEHKSEKPKAQEEHRVGASRRKIKKSSVIVARNAGVTVNFAETARFVLDHGSEETKRQLRNDEITLVVARDRSERQKEARAITRKKPLAVLLLVHIEDVWQGKSHIKDSQVRSTLAGLVVFFRENGLLSIEEANHLRSELGYRDDIPYV